MSVWRLQQLTKRYRSRARWSRAAGAAHDGVTAVDKVSLEVGEGERVGVIGASGSGKTTLARLGLGIVTPTSGSVHLFGEDTALWDRRRWREARSQAQMLFQDPAAMLNPQIPIGLLLEESAMLHRAELDPHPEALRVLHSVGLGSRFTALPRELSGGERRRAGIARLLLTRPRLVVTDELTTGLDAALKADLVRLLFHAVTDAAAVVFISHDLPLVLWCCSRVVVMYRGQCVDQFDTDQIYDPVRHAHTKALVRASGLAGSP